VEKYLLKRGETHTIDLLKTYRGENLPYSDAEVGAFILASRCPTTQDTQPIFSLAFDTPVVYDPKPSKGRVGGMLLFLSNFHSYSKR
jgi:hypothetical protein